MKCAWLAQIWNWPRRKKVGSDQMLCASAGEPQRVLTAATITTATWSPPCTHDTVNMTVSEDPEPNDLVHIEDVSRKTTIGEILNIVMKRILFTHHTPAR